jgi:hypothetical protein
MPGSPNASLLAPWHKAFIRFSERREKLSDSFRRTLLALPEVAEKREDGEQKKLPKPPVLG